MYNKNNNNDDDDDNNKNIIVIILILLGLYQADIAIPAVHTVKWKTSMLCE